MWLCYHMFIELSIPFLARVCITRKRDLYYDDEVSFISNLSVLPLQLLLHTAHVASDSFDAQQTN
jgi:hypothetical protein